MSERIARMKDAIESTHQSGAVHVASETVLGLFQGRVAWDGVVETFELSGHPRAKRCHAWGYEENGVPHYTTALELPPVDSAENAINLAVAAEAKQAMNEEIKGALSRVRRLVLEAQDQDGLSPRR